MSDVIKPKSAEEVQQITQSIEESIKNNSPEDIAAAFFKMEQPRFDIILNSLSHKQMKRFIRNLVLNPYLPKEQQMVTEEEKKAYYIADQMMFNKTIMRLSAEMQALENATNETQGEQNGEETKT